MQVEVCRGYGGVLLGVGGGSGKVNDGKNLTKRGFGGKFKGVWVGFWEILGLVLELVWNFLQLIIK
jgi:hypothetical protein